MDLSDRKRGMRVASLHLTKVAVELTQSVAAMAETLDVRAGAAFDVNAIGIRCNIASIRRELDDLEALIAGRELPIPAPPRAA